MLFVSYKHKVTLLLCTVSLPVMEIADLRTKLKKAQRQASRAAKQDINGVSVVSVLSSNTIFPTMSARIDLINIPETNV